MPRCVDVRRHVRRIKRCGRSRLWRRGFVRWKLVPVRLEQVPCIAPSSWPGAVPLQRRSRLPCRNSAFPGSCVGQDGRAVTAPVRVAVQQQSRSWLAPVPSRHSAQQQAPGLPAIRAGPGSPGWRQARRQPCFRHAVTGTCTGADAVGPGRRRALTALSGRPGASRHTWTGSVCPMQPYLWSPTDNSRSALLRFSSRLGRCRCPEPLMAGPALPETRGKRRRLKTFSEICCRPTEGLGIRWELLPSRTACPENRESGPAELPRRAASREAQKSRNRHDSATTTNCRRNTPAA